MRVLIWSQYFWPESFVINAIAKELEANGVAVTVLTGKPNYPSGHVFSGYRAGGVVREKYGVVDVIRIPLLPRGGGAAIELFLNYISFIVSGYVLAPFVLRNYEFDAVFVYAPSPLLQALPAVPVAKIKKAKLVLWVQDLWPDALLATGFVRNKYILRIVDLVVGYIYRSADSILIQSEAFRSEINRRISDRASSKEKVMYFPNPANDLREEVGSEWKSLVQEIKRNFSVVFAGNIGAAQSCETVLEAAEILREFSGIKFFLIGSGSRSSAIAREVEKSGLANVVLPGRLPEECMYGVFSAASALLVSLREEPSLSATVPSKLPSYLSAGRPVIASVSGEAARLVRAANAGVVCRPDSGVALAQATLELYYADPEVRSGFGRNARDYFERNFRTCDRVRELVAHFDSLVGR